jgi:hypothetical protein
VPTVGNIAASWAPAEFLPLIIMSAAPSVSLDATCVVTEVITTEGKAVGYCYRDDPVSKTDSGWRFLTGSESEAYMEQPLHYITKPLSWVVEHHPKVKDLLDAEIGMAFALDDESGDFLETDE